MADAVADDGRCLLSTCDPSGPLQRFKLRGVKKLIECAQARQDNTTLDIVQAILDSEGDQASVEVSKEHQYQLKEQKHRRVLDADDRALVDKELSKYSHPLEEKRNHLYNPVTGQIAPDDVNVADSLLIGERMVECYTTSLPGGFYAPISSAIKTMGTARKTPKGRYKQSIDLESIFIRLMMIGQRRQLELGPLFDYELCAVPAALIDDQGCLRKGNKSALVKRLGVVESTPTDPDIVIVDVQQLLYRIVWPHGGSPCDVITSIGSRLDRYPHTSEKVIVFDKYENVSAKDHERLRRSIEEATSYELTLTCVLPNLDLIMNSKSNKRRLASVLSTFTVGEMVTMDSADHGVFKHDEADVTKISYVIEAANSGKGTIRVLSDDTDVFVLLVYWVYRLGMVCKLQMERRDGTVLDINATCTNLGPKCMQLLGMHAISGCDMTSYPYAKGKASALKTILGGDFPGLDDVLGEVGATNDDLLQVATTFFLALYGQPAETSINRARFTLYTKKKKSPKVKALPPTSSNLMLHVMRAHLQTMLWKSADQQAPPVESEDITGFGWKLQDGVPVPVVADREPAPPQLSDVINCECKAAGKKCSTEACGCHKEHLSCTSYCNCRGEDGCCNPHTTQGVAQAADDDDEDVEDEEEDPREEVEDIEEDTVLAVDGEDDNADEWD